MLHLESFLDLILDVQVFSPLPIIEIRESSKFQ